MTLFFNNIFRVSTYCHKSPLRLATAPSLSMASEFHRFMDFPAELRYMVWEIAVDIPIVLSITVSITDGKGLQCRWESRIQDVLASCSDARKATWPKLNKHRVPIERPPIYTHTPVLDPKGNIVSIPRYNDKKVDRRMYIDPHTTIVELRIDSILSWNAYSSIQALEFFLSFFGHVLHLVEQVHICVDTTLNRSRVYYNLGLDDRDAEWHQIQGGKSALRLVTESKFSIDQWSTGGFNGSVRAILWGRNYFENMMERETRVSGQAFCKAIQDRVQRIFPEAIIDSGEIRSGSDFQSRSFSLSIVQRGQYEEALKVLARFMKRRHGTSRQRKITL